MKHLKTFESYDDDFEDDDFENERPEEGDYTELDWNMDEYMPEDEEAMEEYYSILDEEVSDEEKIQNLIEFFESGIIQDEARFNLYMPENGSIAGFCEYLVKNKKSTE